MDFPFTLRPSQQEILHYRGGKLGIAAVPGSGKTFTLSALAANIIRQGWLDPEQEVLIVTLVNSAVDNFTNRIGSFIQTQGLIPHLGYRVRTLHGLAHDIVREKPGRVGLEERFGIIDEREAAFIRKDAIQAWQTANPHALNSYLNPELDESKQSGVKNREFPKLLDSLCTAFIRTAKDRLLTPEQLRRALSKAATMLPLAELGLDVYTDYQRSLAYRGAVDFDDLIRLAYELLITDDEFLERLRYRFPYILEDEAQDSSSLQEKILRLLAGESGNWVRVGDPNQAIFETFTTANPKYLREFISHEADFSHDLPQSGRSQPAIIDLANQLIRWVQEQHPEPLVRDALAPPFINPVAKDDPQRNPPENRSAIHILIERKFGSEEESNAVVDSIARWLPENQDKTVAILVPRNSGGADLIDKLKKRDIVYHELLSSTLSTRATAGALFRVLEFLAAPDSPRFLSDTYKVWRRQWREEESQIEFYKYTAGLLAKCRMVESFVYPPYDLVGIPATRNTATTDWLSDIGKSETAEVFEELRLFRATLRRWLEAAPLPIDQLILTIGIDIFTEPADLALAHKLSLVLRQTANDHPDWRLPDLKQELRVIAKNERRFLGFSADDSGFNPEEHKGKVVVTTMHKAKGLEWDRVYIMSANSYDFPSNQPYDKYLSEKWFIRNHLNLEAEALAQLEAVLSPDEYSWYTEGKATLNARIDYVRERLRLLYVGITRAKRELIITWNTGRNGDIQPSLAVQALAGWLSPPEK